MWEGVFHQEQEVILILKTVKQHQSDLVAFIEQHHPYQIPAILQSTAVLANPSFASWAQQQCA